MKRRLTLLTVATFLSMTLMAQWDGSSSTQWTKGSGSETDPYLIESEANLAYLSATTNAGTNYSGKYFKQSADLDLNNKPWTPIGNNSTKFAGEYDGNGFVISNIYYDNNATEYVGLFGYVDKGKLKNITVASGFVYGYQHTAGICGAITNGSIDCCANNATIYGKMERIGGVCGYAKATTITNCINYGLISGYNFTGGIVGLCSTEDVTTENCVNVGQVFGMRFTCGNLIGFNNNKSIISNCYYDNQINTSVGVATNNNKAESDNDIDGKFEGKPTSSIIGTGLQPVLGSDKWYFENGMYPRLKINYNNSAIVLAATPLTLPSGDKADNVTANFTVSTANGVVWTSDNASNLKISGTTASILKSTGVVITATKDGYTKKTYLKTNKTGATAIGTIESPLTIESESDLKAFRAAVNNYGSYKGCAAYDGFKGIYFKVAVDIALSDWTEPVGAHNSFKGVFDGNHRTISGINVNTVTPVGGLFGCASYGKIQDINIKGSVTGARFVGGICGACGNEELINCESECTINIGSNQYAGGIVGIDKGYSTLTNCINTGTISGDKYIAGIMGTSNMGSTFIDCKNQGTVNGTENIGGICGSGGMVFTNCQNSGVITGTSKNSGGIVGTINIATENATINNCINAGAINGDDATCGIGGRLYNNISISNCLNTGKISGTSCSGICSMASGTISVSNSFNAGEICATISGNGIASGATCTNCLNNGKVSNGNAIGNKVGTSIFYDYQMCPIGSSGKLTSEMLGDALKSSLDASYWTFTEGMYPMIKTLENSDYMIVAATPINLNASEPAENVTSVSKTLEYDKNNLVEWECSKVNNEILVSFVNGKGYIANPSANTDVVLTARKGEATKDIAMTITTKSGLIDPDVSWTLNPSTINYGTAITDEMLNATRALESANGQWEYSVNVGDILHAGEHVLTATFIPDDQDTYSIKTASAVLTVNKGDATPFITWEPATSITYGDEDSDSKLKNATATVDGKFYYTIPSLTVGTHTIKLDFIGTDYEASIEKIDAVSVTAASASIAWATPTAIDYGTPLSALQLSAVSGVDGSFTYDEDGTAINEGDLLDAGTHTITVTFNPSSSNYASNTKSIDLVVNKFKPTVTWNTTALIITYGDTLKEDDFVATVDEKYSDKGSISYSEDIRGVLNAGQHTITATFQPTDNNFDTCKVNAVVMVNKATPSIVWSNSTEDMTLTYGTELSATQLNATVSNNDEGSIVYTESNDTIKIGDILDAGTHTISATVDESDNYNKATTTATIIVNKAETTIDWTVPEPITYGDTLSATQLNAVANVDGDFYYSPAIGSTLNAGTQELHVAFIPTDGKNYKESKDTINITVYKATPSITWATPSAIIYGDTITMNQLNATSTAPGPFSYNVNIGDTLDAGDHMLIATLLTDTINYNDASDTVYLHVNQAKPSINWTKPQDIVYGTYLDDTQLNATANVEGEFTYSVEPDSMLNVGTNWIVANFTSENSNYMDTKDSVSINVTPATPIIIWDDPRDIEYGTKLDSTILNAKVDGDIDGELIYVPSIGQVLEIGDSQMLVVTFIPSNNNYTTVKDTAYINVLPGIIWAPDPIAYGTKIGTIFNAEIPIEGTFSYSIDKDSILNAGEFEITVNFTPASSEFKPSQKTVKVTVEKATPVITWDPQDITYGTKAEATYYAKADIQGSFSYSMSRDSILDAGEHEITATFTPSKSNYYNYNTVKKSAIITVNKAESEITWEPQDITYGSKAELIQNATANNEGEFAYSISKDTILNVGKYSITATFTPSTENYNPAKMTIDFNVLKGVPVISWTTPDTIAFGTKLDIFNATANVDGEFTYSVEPDSILNVGDNEITADFTPASSNFESVSSTVTINVTKAPSVAPVITCDSTLTLTYGTGINTKDIKATANVDGEFSYSIANDSILPAGRFELVVSFTSTDLQSVSQSVTVIVNKAKLLASVSSSTIKAGESIPDFAINYKGFVNGDDESAIDTLPSVTCNADNKVAGTYDIVVSGGYASNYEFIYENATLTVEKDNSVVDNEAFINIYPNPTTDAFYVNASDDITEVRIFNAVGKLIMIQPIEGTTRIDISEQPEGTYIVKAGNKMARIIKE